MAASPVALMQVTDVRRITPRTARITFHGEGLDTLPSWPDQQLKLCFPRPGQREPRLPAQDPDGDAMRWYQAFLAIPEDERPWMRSYTVRARDPERGLITVDFVLHENARRAGEGEGAAAADGPATRWARSARPGDVLGRYGPSAEYARPRAPAQWLLLAGDETALPAIATLLEALPAQTRAVACVEVEDAAEEQPLTSGAELTVHWLHRDGAPAGRGEGLLRAVRELPFPPGEAHAWLAGEAGCVRALRRHLVQERGLDKKAVEFTGYWRRGLTQDDAPTEEDLADLRERPGQA